MKVSDNALAIMKERILQENETPEEMVERVVSTVAMGDTKVQSSFRDMISNKYFMPNSPCLTNAGTVEEQLSACFVLPIEDTMQGIMGTLYDASMVQKTGGNPK